MTIDFSADPILLLSESSDSAEAFRQVVSAAVARHPSLGEANAAEIEANAARGEARSGLFPSGNVTISNYQVLTRAFSNDPQNVIERSRAQRRTDATLSLQATVFDFGATRGRIAAATARLVAAQAQTQTAGETVALRAIASWYDVFAYRSLTALAGTFQIKQRELRAALEMRVSQEVAAPGDLAQIDGYISSTDRRVAQFARSLATAEARYAELVGNPPPVQLKRAPVVDLPNYSKEFAISAALNTPEVAAADALARAARADAKAVRASNLPQITAGIDAGRYGVFETERDYDVRANVTLRQRLFGGTVSKERQAEARAQSAKARSERIREESARDAAIAWSDVQALQTELTALRQNYIAARRTRDVLTERFRVSRGTIVEIMQIEDNYLQSASSYIQVLVELDSARYALLARTGRLLATLQIDPQQSLKRQWRSDK